MVLNEIVAEALQVINIKKPETGLQGIIGWSNFELSHIKLNRTLTRLGYYQPAAVTPHHERYQVQATILRLVDAQPLQPGAGPGRGPGASRS